jgi:hypothetical protein
MRIEVKPNALEWATSSLRITMEPEVIAMLGGGRFASANA